MTTVTSAENFQRKKLSQIFEVLWLFVKLFVQNLGMQHPLAAQPQMFSPSKVFRYTVYTCFFSTSPPSYSFLCRGSPWVFRMISTPPSIYRNRCSVMGHVLPVAGRLISRQWQRSLLAVVTRNTNLCENLHCKWRVCGGLGMRLATWKLSARSRGLITSHHQLQLWLLGLVGHECASTEPAGSLSSALSV